MTITDSHPTPFGDDHFVLTDGGLETTLIFERGFDLPGFAAFPLVDSELGRDALRDYYEAYLAVARSFGLPIVLETPTWRASRDWGAELGYDADALDRVNTDAVRLLDSLRSKPPVDGSQVFVSGNIGPRGDGYRPGDQMSPEAAEHYHLAQLRSLAAAGAEMASAMTLTYTAEAIGIARAARTAGLPAVIWFTVETDGRLPTTQELGDAIVEVDAATDAYPASYGINCAHPDHFAGVVERGGTWVERIGHVRVNASRLSHEQLDEAETLDAGNPVALGHQCAALRSLLPGLRVLGGCCGTDHTHVAEMAAAWVGAAPTLGR